MSRSSRLLTIAVSQAQDLLRRRLAMVMLGALPAAFFLSVAGVMIRPGQDPWTVEIGAIGVAWAVAGGSFFLSLASRRVDDRLMLAGYSPIELVLGRLLFLEAFGLVVAAGYSVLIIAVSDVAAGPLALAVAVTAIIAVSLGLALASLFQRELEGTLALVVLIGVTTSVPSHEPLARFLPFYGPVRLVIRSWTSHGAIGAPLIHGLVATTVLFALAVVLWARQLPTRTADSIDTP